MKKKQGSVYIVRHRGRLKIGYSWHLAMRLAQIRRETKTAPRLVGAVPGTFNNERSVHRLLIDSRCERARRTWYRPTKQVRALIAELLAPGFLWEACAALREADDRYNSMGALKYRWNPRLNPSLRPATASEVFCDNLMSISRAYAKARGISLNQVSKLFYGNVDFLKKISTKKQSISLAKFDEMIEQFRKKWPEGAEWPACRAFFIRGPKRKLSPAKSRGD